jgi:hypothetical protein
VRVHVRTVIRRTRHALTFVSRELSAATIYGPTLTFQTGRAYDLLADGTPVARPIAPAQ